MGQIFCCWWFTHLNLKFYQLQATYTKTGRPAQWALATWAPEGPVSSAWGKGNERAGGRRLGQGLEDQEAEGRSVDTEISRFLTLPSPTFNVIPFLTLVSDS